MTTEATSIDVTEAAARALDDADALQGLRERFYIPPAADGAGPVVYLLSLIHI